MRLCFQNSDNRNFFRRHELGGVDEQIPIMSSGIDVDAFCQRVGAETKLQQLRAELGLTGKRVSTMITRLIKPKGIEEFLQSAAAVQNRHSDVKFLLIGNLVNNGLQAIPVERIHQSTANVLHLRISKRYIPNILAISDLFVLPSYFREGAPRVLLEAAALRVPLIHYRSSRLQGNCACWLEWLAGTSTQCRGIDDSDSATAQ